MKVRFWTKYGPKLGPEPSFHLGPETNFENGPPFQKFAVSNFSETKILIVFSERYTKLLTLLKTGGC